MKHMAVRSALVAGCAAQLWWFVSGRDTAVPLLAGPLLFGGLKALAPRQRTTGTGAEPFAATRAAAALLAHCTDPARG